MDSKVSDHTGKMKDFPSGPVVKPSPSNAGDTGLTPPQRTNASLVAQRLKRLPAMQGTWVRSLGR